MHELQIVYLNRFLMELLAYLQLLLSLQPPAIAQPPRASAPDSNVSIQDYLAPCLLGCVILLYKCIITSHINLKSSFQP